MRLVPPPGKIVSGKIIFEGENLLDKNESYMRRVRGRKISMILQDPSTALNPVFTIGSQVAEAIRAKYSLKKTALRTRVTDALDLLRFPAPEKRLGDYPHQLSGGMKQRVAGAIALSVMPQLLMADEPTTALDVTIQAQYLQEIKNLQQRFNLSTIFVTHDFGVVEAICDRVSVMYAGKIVEQAESKELFANALHPYTVGLLNSLPRLDIRVEKLPMIPGEPPSLVNLPGGCSYFPRCTVSKPRCKYEAPPAKHVSEDHLVRCWKVC
jgi:peptide/nickel transport system ATP-binding protein/oligopeptide transport system ATP-binding protein